MVALLESWCELKRQSVLILYLVSISLLGGCVQRTILHGRDNVTAPVVDNKIVLWFVKPEESGLKLVKVSRPLAGKDRMHQAVEELLNGPSVKEEKGGLGSEIPKGTILLGIERKGRNVELNLSRRFASGGGATSFETRLAQLKRTIAPVAGSHDVYLNVEGARLNMSPGEGIEVLQPINR